MLDVLRAELERLFDLDELRAASIRHFAVDPCVVDDANTTSALAGTLVGWAAEHKAVEALADFVVTSRRGADKRLQELQQRGFEPDDETADDGAWNGFTIERELGRSALAKVFEASLGDVRHRMRVLRPDASFPRGSLQRYLVASRLVNEQEHIGLPTRLQVLRSGERLAVLHDLPPGEPLTRRLGTACKLGGVWFIVRGILEALSALHRQRLVHGALHPDNILVEGTEGAGFVTLVDAGSYFLRSRELVGGVAAGRAGVLPLAYASPEQLVGELPTSRSDVYAFGLVLHVLLTGRRAFEGEGRALVARRFGRPPEPLRLAAPHGWIVPELDELMLALLDANPSGRPADAEAVLDMLESVAVHSHRVASSYPDEAFEAFLQRLEEAPTDEMAAGLLDASIEQGASATRVAEAFSLAAMKLDDAPGDKEAKRRLLLKAGALFEGPARDGKAAASAYRTLLEDDPDDEVVWASLERALRGLGRYEELVDRLVDRAHRARSLEEKARFLETLGDVLATKLDEPAEAIVAYAHALIEQPANRALAQAVERLAGSDRAVWSDVLDTLAREVDEVGDLEARNRLLSIMGAWHRDRLRRLDAALQCFQTILMTEPAHDEALRAIADLYRRARQWQELADVLLERAEGAVTPAMSRDLRAEAAALFASELEDSERAMQLYEGVLEEDPTHVRAGQGLSELYLAADQRKQYVELVRGRAVLMVGEPRLALLFELARLHETRFGDDAVAIELYEQIISEDPTHLQALRRLDASYSAAGRHEELIGVLSRQLDLSVSPRQKSRLLRRMVNVYVREIGDKEQAAETLERLLDVEPSYEPALDELEELYGQMREWASLAWVLERHAARLHNPHARADKLLELGELAAGPLEEPSLAIDAYERVRALRPKDATALAALASLQATTGDVARAAEALEALAEAETDARRRADYQVQAGEILLLRGQGTRAMTLFQQALDGCPGHATAASKLHGALLAKDDVDAALQVLERAILESPDASGKAALSAELAETRWERKRDAPRAHAAATLAIEHEPDSVRARLLLAELDRSRGDLEGARRRYEAILGHLRDLGPKHAARLLGGLAETRAKLGDAPGALSLIDELVAAHGHDRDALRVAADVSFLVEDHPRTVELAGAIVHKYGRTMAKDELATCLYWRGESLRRMGRLDEAIAPLERAVSVDNRSLAPLRSLAEVYRSQKKLVQVCETLLRVLDRVQGKARVDVLLEIGTLADKDLDDRTMAAKTYLAALTENPGDRRILLGLARLYSAERDWAHLIEAIVKLVDLVEDGPQRAKYLRTAARVAAEEMKDLERADGILGQALSHDEGNLELISEAIEIKSGLNDTEGVRVVLAEQLEKAFERGHAESAFWLARKLAEVHLSWAWFDEAIGLLERTHEAVGHEPALDDMLLNLYARDPIRYLDRAAELTRFILGSAPHLPGPYRILRRMYSAAKRRDATWLTCQALTVLGSAEPDEVLYFRRFRLDGFIPKLTRITDQEFAELIEHPYVDPVLSQVIRLIEPSLVAARGQNLEELGYDAADALDPETSPMGLVPVIHDVAKVLGQAPPLLFENPRAIVPVTMVAADRPVLLLSSAAVESSMPTGRAAFLAASHLCFFRPGYYARALVPALTLKAWIQAATKVVVPSLPVAPDLAGLTREAHGQLTEHLTGAMHDQLARAVHDLIGRRSRPDIARWMAGVDLTSDRLGLVVSADLPSCLAIISAAQGVGNTLSSSERGRDLLAYSVSGPYLTLRDRLQLSIDWREVDDLPLGEEPEPEWA